MCCPGIGVCLRENQKPPRLRRIIVGHVCFINVLLSSVLQIRNQCTRSNVDEHNVLPGFSDIDTVTKR